MKTASIRGRSLMWVIWPAFLVAGVAEHFFGAPLDWSRQAIYTLGFFGFWGLGIASSALTLWLERAPVLSGPGDVDYDREPD